MKPKKLTEEMPESLKDLKQRGLVLNEDGIVTGQQKQQYLTEDLPQEEEND